MNQLAIEPYNPQQMLTLSQALGAQVVENLRYALQAGFTWVAWIDDTAVAWATAMSVPGLERVVEIDGGVLESWQRQRIGTRFLETISSQLALAGIHQISYGCDDPDAPVNEFLQQNGFVPEHEEWEMVLTDLSDLPPLPDNSATLLSLPRTEAIEQFVALYDRAFAPTAWYQPFSLGEVAATLRHGSEIRFLQQEDTLVGFAWLRMMATDTTIPDTVQVEPIGIVPEVQGQGYGRYLLLSILHELAQRGIRTVLLGVWRRNETAVHLYQQLGFQRTSTTLFLARTLNPA